MVLINEPKSRKFHSPFCLYYKNQIKTLTKNFQSFCVSKIAIKEQNFTLSNESKDHYQASVSMASFNSP